MTRERYKKLSSCSTNCVWYTRAFQEFANYASSEGLSQYKGSFKWNETAFTVLLITFSTIG